MAHVAGLVAAGIYPNPLPHADVVTTTTHKTLRGPRGGLILARANDEITKKLNSLVFPGTQGGPLMHAIAAKAVALLEALQPEFHDYQKQVLTNARAMAARLKERGYQIVSGGTDNHLFLLSLADRNITGKAADAALGRANITVNKNAVPNDPRPPMVTSGLRLGTPASTTRGFKQAEIELVADFIAQVLDAEGAEEAVQRVRPQVIELCRRFPVYGANAPHALPVLRPRRNQGERLAPRRRGTPDPAPARVPEVRGTLHHLRDRRTADAARHQGGPRPRGLR
jgi:glycine hydroxymethyltransferase